MTTAEYPQLIRNNAQLIRDSVPRVEAVPAIPALFDEQERIATNMAAHLESLAAHYDQMAAALRDKEAGEEFSEDDLQGAFWSGARAGLLCMIRATLGLCECFVAATRL